MAPVETRGTVPVYSEPMRDFYGELHCVCLSFDLVLEPVTTPDALMEVVGHVVTCVSCEETFHDADGLPLNVVPLPDDDAGSGPRLD
jgi:hypothetical protein